MTKNHLQGILDDIISNNHCTISNILALARSSDLPSKSNLGYFFVTFMQQKHPHCDLSVLADDTDDKSLYSLTSF